MFKILFLMCFTVYYLIYFDPTPRGGLRKYLTIRLGVDPRPMGGPQNFLLLSASQKLQRAPHLFSG